MDFYHELTVIRDCSDFIFRLNQDLYNLFITCDKPSLQF